MGASGQVGAAAAKSVGCKSAAAAAAAAAQQVQLDAVDWFHIHCENTFCTVHVCKTKTVNNILNSIDLHIREIRSSVPLTCGGCCSTD